MAENNEQFEVLGVRIPVDLKERLEAAAKREERTLSGFVRFHLAQMVGAEPECQCGVSDEPAA